MAEDYYQTLGVSRNASADEIQSAYRKLARKYHPDLNPDDDSAKKKFQEVQTAFDVLNDPSKRELYDRYGSSFESMGAGGGPRTGAGPWSSAPGGGWSGGGWSGSGGSGTPDFDFSQFFGGGGEGAAGFGDIFSQFRRAPEGGKRARSTASKRGTDIAADVTIPFNTAVLGGETELAFQDDSGHIKRVAVKIPAGLEDGKKIRLRGQGGPARRGGTPGDLLITVHVAPHPSFTRRGNHLDVKVPVTLAEAALGAKVDVPTPQGTISLRVPAGTSSGTKLRAKGRGVVPKTGEPGDLYAEIEIILPKNLDERSQELIRELDARFQQSPVTLRQDLRW